MILMDPFCMRHKPAMHEGAAWCLVLLRRSASAAAYPSYFLTRTPCANRPVLDFF
jgi:hypothetical protein